MAAIVFAGPVWAAEGGAGLEALKEAAQKLAAAGDPQGALLVYRQAVDAGAHDLKPGSDSQKRVNELRAKADGMLESNAKESVALYAEALDIVIKETVHKAGLTDVNIPTLIWAWVSFGVTFLALKKVAWPMLAKKMEERELRIAEGLKKAEEAEKRAQELLTKQEQILDEARKEAQKVLADGRAAAEHSKADMLSAAQKEIEAQRERAKKEIGLERAKAVEDLKRAAVELTLEASARLLKREIRDDDHRRLARQVIDEVVAKK
jgi:F-type H+-transporting ATPase subunit b